MICCCHKPVALTPQGMPCPVQIAASLAPLCLAQDSVGPTSPVLPSTYWASPHLMLQRMHPVWQKAYLAWSCNEWERRHPRWCRTAKNKQNKTKNTIQPICATLRRLRKQALAGAYSNQERICYIPKVSKTSIS